MLMLMNMFPCCAQWRPIGKIRSVNHAYVSHVLSEHKLKHELWLMLMLMWLLSFLGLMLMFLLVLSPRVRI